MEKTDRMQIVEAIKAKRIEMENTYTDKLVEIIFEVKKIEDEKIALQKKLNESRKRNLELTGKMNKLDESRQTTIIKAEKADTPEILRLKLEKANLMIIKQQTDMQTLSENFKNEKAELVKKIDDDKKVLAEKVNVYLNNKSAEIENHLLTENTGSPDAENARVLLNKIRGLVGVSDLTETDRLHNKIGILENTINEKSTKMNLMEKRIVDKTKAVENLLDKISLYEFAISELSDKDNINEIKKCKTREEVESLLNESNKNYNNKKVDETLRISRMRAEEIFGRRNEHEDNSNSYYDDDKDFITESYERSDVIDIPSDMLFLAGVSKKKNK